MRIAIIHYHLKRGGVTRVIESMLRGFDAQEAAPQCVVLAGEVPEDFRYKDRSCVVWGLHYSNAQSETPESRTLVERLRAAARKSLGGDPDCWHIHNHSLGKNSAMPGVVAALAEAGDALLLQMHDFAEDGRPENYRLNLERPECAKYLYPNNRNVHYACINARDEAVFRQAGVHPDRIHLLANPVEASAPQDVAQAETIRAALGAKRLFLYPVRAVRRKNFGEMLLWAAQARPGDVFATTLGPTNQNYAAAYQDWQAFAQTHQLPVHFGIGESFDWPFEAIMQSAHAILNTSIAEGFGLAFLEPWLFGKAIVGRDLPDITADFKARGIQLEHLYPSLPLPAEWIDKNALATAIGKGLGAAYAAYDRPLPHQALECALDAIHPTPDTIDFGGLNEALQKSVIERVRADPSAKKQLAPLESFNDIIPITHNADQVVGSYSLPNYAEKLMRIYRSIQPGPGGPTSYIEPAKILDEFLQPERFRLLRT